MSTGPGTYHDHPSQVPAAVDMMAAQQQLLHQHREVEYFYVYVAESEQSNVGHWILLEPDKTLSLQNLRTYYSTCFGIKYNTLNIMNNVETKYIRYHNGYFRFPVGMDMNNTRFVAYYYNDQHDVKAFMEMVDHNDDVVGPNTTAPALAFQSQPGPAPLLLPTEQYNDSTLLGKTAFNFEMENVLVNGAQSTPTKQPVTAFVSSTSDVVFNEPTAEAITVHASQSQIVNPSPGPVPAQAAAYDAPPPEPVAPSVVTGVKAKLGPAVSSTSEGAGGGRKTGNDSEGFKREKSSVMIKPVAAPRDKNMLNRYQRSRPSPERVREKSPLKITLKTRGRQAPQRNAKILKIEDERGRTTALLTKRKWAPPGKGSSGTGGRGGGGHKRRAEPDENYEDEEQEERYEKRRKYDNRPQHQQQQQQQYYRQTEPKVSALFPSEDYYRTLNVLLVGFHTSAPIIHETTGYFAEFGIVQNLQLYTLDNWRSHPEYYAFMTIRTDDAVSLFSDRHLYNGTVIYAIRIDDNRLPARLTCKVCGYQGLNVGYLHYHFEGSYHQIQLQKRLDALAGTVGNIYRDSYYRITYEEVYVQYPNDAIQEMVRNDYWKRTRHSGEPAATAGPSNRYYSTERERYY